MSFTKVSKTQQRNLDREAMRADVSEVYKRCGYRVCKHGHTTAVSFGFPRVESDTLRGGYYSSRCKWRKWNSFHRIVVPFTWSKRVKAIGLETLDGMLVLSAEYRAVTRAGSPVMMCRVVHQGPGTSIVQGVALAAIGENGWEQIDSGNENIVHAEAIPAGVDFIRDHGFDVVADVIIAAENGDDRN